LFENKKAKTSVWSHFKVDALLTIETWTTADDFLVSVMSRYVGPNVESPERGEFDKQSKSTQGAVVKVRLIDWLNDWSIDWFGWLIHLIDWLIDWWIDYDDDDDDGNCDDGNGAGVIEMW
jgi:hypothetical protein